MACHPTWQTSGMVLESRCCPVVLDEVSGFGRESQGWPTAAPPTRFSADLTDATSSAGFDATRFRPDKLGSATGGNRGALPSASHDRRCGR